MSSITLIITLKPNSKETKADDVGAKLTEI
jgi:hypothetical protein